MNQQSEQQTKPPDDGAGKQAKPKLPTEAHVMCAWPLLLVAIGGAIGGALGGAAYGVNLAIYKSKLPVIAKVSLNILTGVAAIGIWLVIAAVIQSYRNK